jgi:hypothetical protein
LNYPELLTFLNQEKMKTLNFKQTNDIFVKFSLSNEEMIKVRGGNDDSGDPKIVATPPPVKI